METLKRIKKQAEKPKVTGLLPAKESISEDVKNYESKLRNLGINNSTAETISREKKRIEEKAQEVKKQDAVNQVLNAIMGFFSGYKIVDYKIMHEICVDYGLYIHSLSAYFKPIPSEVIDGLDSFIAKLTKRSELFPEVSQKMYCFMQNNHSILEYQFNKSIGNIPIDKMFMIAAPKNHFRKKSFNEIVGRNLLKEPTIQFDYSFKVLKPEPPRFDPIIFVPFQVKERVYCTVIEGWEKEGDDNRILNSI